MHLQWHCSLECSLEFQKIFQCNIYDILGLKTMPLDVNWIWYAVCDLNTCSSDWRCNLFASFTSDLASGLDLIVLDFIFFFNCYQSVNIMVLLFTVSCRNPSSLCLSYGPSMKKHSLFILDNILQMGNLSLWMSGKEFSTVPLLLYSLTMFCR